MLMLPTRPRMQSRWKLFLLGFTVIESCYPSKLIDDYGQIAVVYTIGPQKIFTSVVPAEEKQYYDFRRSFVFAIFVLDRIGVMPLGTSRDVLVWLAIAVGRSAQLW